MHRLRERGQDAWVLPNPETTAIFTPYLEGLLAPEAISPDRGQRGHGRSGLFPENAQQYLERVDLAFDHHPLRSFLPRTPAWTPSGRPAAS